MVAIAFEGKSDKELLDSILEAYNLPRDNTLYFEFMGKDNIFNIAHAHYNEIEESLKKIDKMLIIVDADNDKDPNPNRGYIASKKALLTLIENLEFNIPIDFYIMCDENKQGNLESFLLSILDNEQKECFKTFIECYQYDLSDKKIYNIFYKDMKHPFDFDHQNFDILKSKLQWLFEE